MDVPSVFLHGLISLLLCAPRVFSDGAVLTCPQYGCRPSGSFSYVLETPLANASVAWTSSLFIGPVPNALGCVANGYNVISQSNGPREVSYINLYIRTGGLVWRDFLLRFPQLPVTDPTGGIWGSDGHFLVIYDGNGRFRKQAFLNSNVFPIFSITKTDNDILLIVSKNGHIVSFHLDGSPHDSITLNGTMLNKNGTFLPIAPPAIAANRTFVLTQFQPSGQNLSDGKPTNEYRLYIIDVFDRASDGIHVTRYMDLHKSTQNHAHSHTSQSNIDQFDRSDDQYQDTQTAPDPRVMCTSDGTAFYVSLPKTNRSGVLFGFVQDGGHVTTFQRPISLSKMSMYTSVGITRDDRYECTRIQSRPKKPAGQARKSRADEFPTLWGLKGNKEVIIGFDSLHGSTVSVQNISKIFKVRMEVTSEVMVVRPTENSTNEYLVFGVKRTDSEPSPAFAQLCESFAVDGTANSYLVQLSKSSVSWMVASPRNLTVVGQIAGVRNSKTSGKASKDLLAAFAGNSLVSTVFGVW